ncbi:hypothetical protein ACOME3_010628, partial [Neoechinorhynchus agilis]
RDLYFIKYPSKDWGTLLNTETDKSSIAKLIGVTIDEKADSDIVRNGDLKKLINYINQADKKDPQIAINGPLTSTNKIPAGSPLSPVSTPNAMPGPANYPIASSGESAPGMESRVSIGSSPETEAIEMKKLNWRFYSYGQTSNEFGVNQNNWMNQNYHSGWNRRYKGYGTQTLASEASKAAIPSPQNTKKIDTEVSITEISAQPKNEEMDDKSIIKDAESLDIDSMKTNSPELTETTTTESLRTTDLPIDKIKINIDTSRKQTTLFPQQQQQQPVQIIQYFFQQPFAPPGNSLPSAVLPVDLPFYRPANMDTDKLIENEASIDKENTRLELDELKAMILSLKEELKASTKTDFNVFEY